MNQQEFEAFSKAISTPRLTSYKDFFKPSSNQELVGYYLWAQALSAAMHPLVGLTEVVLRNAIHSSLSLKCSLGASTSFHWYDKTKSNMLSLRGKSLEKVEGLLYHTPQGSRLYRSPQPTPDKVVSELTFGFWPNVMESLNQNLAPKTFYEVFTYHPQSKIKHWSYLDNRKSIVLSLKRIQALRNRVCHFEALWKPHWMNTNYSRWWQAVQAIRDLHDDVTALLGWCSPEAANLYKGSFAWDWFNKLCTTNAVKSFSANHAISGLLEPMVSPSSIAPPSP